MNILETINLEKIIMINEEEVKKFLSEHEEIANFLPKAFTELDKYFLENKFLLELYFSYEDEDYKQLIIYIRHNLDAKKAMDLLDEFCNKFSNAVEQLKV